jgi:hypothetical protein
MIKRRELLGMTVLAGAGLFGLWRRDGSAAQSPIFPVMHTDAEWRSLLGPAAYDVLRRQGTEIPFSSKLDLETRAGTYGCMAARGVTCRSSLPRRSTTATRDGRASGNRYPTRLRKAVTRASGWTAPKFIAFAAADTLATCFPTARVPPVCAIV